MNENSDESFDSSDEDIYTNAVARLKALKNKEKLRSKQIEEDSFIPDNLSPIEILDEKVEEINRKNSETNVSDERIEIVESPKPDSSESISSDSETSDDDLQVTAVEKGYPQTHCIASIVLDPDDTDDLIPADDTSKHDISESENYNIDVKVFWQSHKLVRLDMRRYEPFQKAFEYFANLESVPIEQILLLRNDKPIKPTDTPASLGISIIDIIEGGVMDTEYVGEKGKAIDDSDEDVCRIKVQKSQKESIMISLQKDQPFKFVILQCATQLNVPDSKIRLYFDGDLISSDDTPESLDLEQEACVDLKVIS